MKDLINKYYSYLIAFAAGAALMYFVYPTKRIEETVTSRYEKQLQEVQEQSSKTVSDVSKAKDQTISDLNQSIAIYKLQVESLDLKVSEMSSHKVQISTKTTKPDGTIEEKTYVESQESSSQKIASELKYSYDQQIQQLRTEWEKVSEEERTKTEQTNQEKMAKYEKEIQDLKQTKVTETNVKKFGLEVGATTDKAVYVHGTYDVLGPVFIGAETQKMINSDHISAGVGLGIRI